MADQPAAPILMVDAVLQLGADTFQAAASKIQITPTTPVQVWQGLGANVQAVVGVPTWNWDIDFSQDPSALTSLSEYLRVNAGKTVTAVLKPKKPASGTAATYTQDVVCVPGAIGGQLNSIATASVSLPANGQPVRTVV